MRIVLAIPVFNGAKILSKTIDTLHDYMSENMTEDWTIVIVNRGSTDRTREVAETMTILDNVEAVHLQHRGKGNAIGYVWTHFSAHAYAYCDPSLSIDPKHIGEMLDLVFDGYDVVTGSRYRKSRKREAGWIKRFNTKIRKRSRRRLTDPMCSMKAVSENAADEIIPNVRDRYDFFDTELMLKALRLGKVKEIQVRWKRTKRPQMSLSQLMDHSKQLIRTAYI